MKFEVRSFLFDLDLTFTIPAENEIARLNPAAAGVLRHPPLAGGGGR